MLAELFKCFLTGFAGLSTLVLLCWLTWLAWPWSGYVWCGLFFIGTCIAAGADARSGRIPR